MKSRLRFQWWLCLPAVIPLIAGYFALHPLDSPTDKKLKVLLADTDRVDVFQECPSGCDWNARVMSLTKQEAQTLFQHMKISRKETFAFGTVGWGFKFYRRSQCIQAIELQFDRSDAELIFSQPSPYGFPRAVWLRAGWPAYFDDAVRKTVRQKTGKSALPWHPDRR